VNVETKICGLVRPDDARLADQAGADYLGVVFAPSPRRRTEEQARRIWEGMTARRAGVFVDSKKDDLFRLAGNLELAVIQLHGTESPEYCRDVGSAGSWAVWKAVKVLPGTSLDEMLASYAGAVDGILLEGWSDLGQGGVGASFDWSLAADMRDRWPEDLRFILAGGLNAQIVRNAIDQARPDVVDVSSGVEKAMGMKDAEAVRAFVAAAK